jgi:hypothetical protein
MQSFPQFFLVLLGIVFSGSMSKILPDGPTE